LAIAGPFHDLGEYSVGSVFGPIRSQGFVSLRPYFDYAEQSRGLDR